jgi:hypothetical protein
LKSETLSLERETERELLEREREKGRKQNRESENYELKRFVWNFG